MDDRSESPRGAGHGCPAGAHHDRNDPELDLSSPLAIRGLTLRNRIAVSPMCQYSSVDGLADDWHLVHLGSRAAGGAGLVFTEATAVTADGRISPADLGLWDDRQGEPLARIVAFIQRMGASAGIQLAHAGRKASCRTPWEGGARIAVADGGWPVLGPSPIPFAEGDPPPIELDEPAIGRVVAAFAAAARRAIAAGFQVIELHAAHGYLIHEFLSPLSNRRTDRYGGSLDNRMRLAIEVAEALRRVVPDSMPLFTRISATDWVDGGWDLDQSIALARQLKARGVDLIDVSSGALVPAARIPVGRGYQVPFARSIRDQAGIATGAVGLITEAGQALEIVTSGAADLVMIGREMLRDPYWALHAHQSLRLEAPWPQPYGYAVNRVR